MIPGFSNPAQAPTGFGYLLTTVDTAGKVKVTGAAADGYLLNQNVVLSKNGEWPFYVPLYKEKRVYTLGTTQVTNTHYQGSMIGWLAFETNTPAGPGATNLAPQGFVSWMKQPWTNAIYPGGFAGSFEIKSSRYVPPPSGTRVLNMTSGHIIVTNGNISGSISNRFNLGIDNRVQMTPTAINSLRITLTPSTGFMGGSFTHPQKSDLVARIFGVVLQDYNYGRGYFLGTNQTGIVRLNGN